MSDINNMFSKFRPQATVRPTTSESSEVTSKAQEVKKEQNSLTFLNRSETFVPLATTRQPEVKLRETTKTKNKIQIKVILKATENSKENITEKATENVPQEPQKIADENEEEAEVKPLGLRPSNNVTSVFGSSTHLVTTTASISVTSEVQKPLEVKSDINREESQITEISQTSPASAASSLFAAAANAYSLTAIKQQSIFRVGTAPTTQSCSIFGMPTSSSAKSTDSTEKPLLFGTAVPSASSMFEVAATQTKTTQSGSIMDTTVPAGVFSSISRGYLFSTVTTTTCSSFFGASTTPSVFTSKAKPSASATATFVFGSTTTTSLHSVFTFSASSVFTAASKPSSIFAPSDSGSIFGTATNVCSVSGSSKSTPTVFRTATTQPSVFGTPASTTQSIFGTAAVQPSVFRSPATTSKSVFGTSIATTQTYVFGAPTSQPSVFGSSAQPSQGSILRSPSNQTSVSGSQTPATLSSVFGAAPTTQASSMLETGSTNSSTFASTSTTTVPTQSSGRNIFGGSSTRFVFGDGSANVFGSKFTFNPWNQTAASFRHKLATNFWSGGQQQGSTQASSSFGGPTSGSFVTPKAGRFEVTENKYSVFGYPQQQTDPVDLLDSDLSQFLEDHQDSIEEYYIDKKKRN